MMVKIIMIIIMKVIINHGHISNVSGPIFLPDTYQCGETANSYWQCPLSTGAKEQ